MRGIQHRRDDLVRKHRARMDTLTHQVSAEIVGYAVRKSVERIELDLADRGYVASFPWHELAERIGYKADEHDIEVAVCDSSGDVDT